VAITEDGEAVVPGNQALALVDYLLSLKRDDALPASMSHLPPPEKDGSEKAAAPAAAPKG
jgi:hypothetical protein